MATKNNPGKYDCYHHAHPDEPLFVLLGHDKMAPALVRQWAAQRRVAGENPEKVAEAEACADAMEAWQHASSGPPQQEATPDQNSAAMIPTVVPTKASQREPDYPLELLEHLDLELSAEPYDHLSVSKEEPEK